MKNKESKSKKPVNVQSARKVGRPPKAAVKASVKSRVKAEKKVSASVSLARALRNTASAKKIKPAYQLPAANSSLQTTQKLSLDKVIWLLVVVLVVAVIYYFRGQFVVATVNGEMIPRWELVSNLEKQSGKAVLDNMVIERLVFQEAKKQKVNISADQISAKSQEIEERIKLQGQTLDSFLQLQGISKSEFERQIKLQLIVEQILGSETKVEDAELDAYIEQNKSALPKDVKIEDVREEFRTQLEQQKMSQKIQEWISELQNNAKIEQLLFKVK